MQVLSETSTILCAIGHTPLARLRRLAGSDVAEVWVKAEYLNPSGSLKDRIALRMIEGAERCGRLRPGGMIVEASTGNTGIALSFVGAVKGYRVRIYMPEQLAATERAKLMQTYGAEVVPVDVKREAEARSMHGGLVEIVPRILCREAEQASDNVWWARQFSSPDNVSAHREETGQEILRDLTGPIDAFVASVGTGGTLLRITQALRARWSHMRVVAVEPANDPLLARTDLPIVEGITDGIIQDIRAEGMRNDIHLVGDQDAIETAHVLSQLEGSLRVNMR